MSSRHGHFGRAGPRRGGTTGAVIAGVVVLAVAGLVVFALVRAAGGPAPANGETGASGIADQQTVERILESVQTYVRDGEQSKAIAVLSTAVAEHPDDQDLRLAYGQLLMQAQRLEEAFEQYEAASTIGPMAPEDSFTAGTLAATVGRTEDAVRHYDLAQRTDPSNARYPLYLAQMQLKLGMKTEATASLVRASVLDESNATIWGSLASVALSENRVNLALQHIAKARALEPTSRDWRLIEGKAMKRAGRAEDALGVLMAIGDTVYTDDEALGAIAECYAMLSEPGEALGVYEEALSRSTPTPERTFQAALWADRAGAAERSLELARQAAMMGHEGAAKLAARLSADD